jgi:hypothetical protein
MKCPGAQNRKAGYSRALHSAIFVIATISFSLQGSSVLAEAPQVLAAYSDHYQHFAA